MKRLTLIAFALSATLLAPAPPAAAQEARSTPAQKNLAVEIDGERYRGHQLSVQGGTELSPVERLPGWEQPAGAAQLIAFKFDNDFEGDAVRIKVALVFDDSWPAEAPGPKYGRKEQAVGSYLVREGESVKVEDLARFGVEPLTLKVVKAKPKVMQPQPALASTPLVANNLKAVQVVGIAPDQSPANRNTYKVRLQNVSRKGITALSLHEEYEGGRSSLTAQGGAERPLIAPGDVYEAGFRFNVDRGATPPGHVSDAERQRTLKVGTVIFDDGTYEGEAKTAAAIFAERRGKQVQGARALPLLREMLAAPSLDAAAALDKLKSEVESLRIDADPAAAAELLAQFPSLARGDAEKHLERDTLKSLALQLMGGLKTGRHSLLHTIKQWEEMRARAPETFDLRRQITAFVEQIEKGSRP